MGTGDCRTRAGVFLVCAALALGVRADDAGVWTLSDAQGLDLVNVVARPARFEGREGLQVSPRDGATGARPAGARSEHLVVVPGDFRDGTIEVELAGAPAPGAPGEARGFVGVAFRVQPDRGTYEAFYLRPTNGRAEDQERRNHTAQYVSHPDHPWYELRRDAPSRYESYVDVVPAQWIPVRVEVAGDRARLYVHGNEQPTLIVNDLLGDGAPGAVALWIEGSTIAHFRNLTIRRTAP